MQEVALSDANGSADLRIPAAHPMLSTIDSHNRLDTGGVVRVQRQRLDDYQISPVGFIKIDVEGHELAVLEGARRTIGTEQPNVLSEAEERHNADSVAAVAAGYFGYFLLEGRLRPVAEFAAATHQDPGQMQDGRRCGTYINNFLFVPGTNLQRIPARYLVR